VKRRDKEKSPLPRNRGTAGARAGRGRGTGKGTDTMDANVKLEFLHSPRRVMFPDRYSLRESQLQQGTGL